MERLTTVYCSRYKEQKPALAETPMSGPIGQLIAKHVSQDAWDEWLEVQIKIINEERLDLSEEAMQQRLYQQMVNFLGLSDKANHI